MNVSDLLLAIVLGFSGAACHLRLTHMRVQRALAERSRPSPLTASIATAGPAVLLALNAPHGLGPLLIALLCFVLTQRTYLSRYQGAT